MRYRLVVFSGVLVLRRITTSDVSARQAQSQVNPFITDLDALFTEALAGTGDSDLVKMCAEWRRLQRSDHRAVLLPRECNSSIDVLMRATLLYLFLSS
jgi:hypothetical protein